MKKRILAILLVMAMLGLTACDDSSAKELSTEDLKNIYQTAGVQAIDEITEGVTFADPAWTNTISEEGTYHDVYSDLTGTTKSSLTVHSILYGLGSDVDEATAKVEAYREHLLSQGYTEYTPGEDEWFIWDGMFVKEDVAVILWSSGGRILDDEDDGKESVAAGQIPISLEIIPIK